MNSQDFLILNLVAAGGFALWYLLSRGGPTQPTRLNLKAPDTAPTVLEPLPEPSPAPTQAPNPQERPQKDFFAAPKKEKNLNVMFIYNGHSWDAYEVLGVPAGASLPVVTQAYQQALRKCTGPEAIDFLETAYKSILSKS